MRTISRILGISWVFAALFTLCFGMAMSLFPHQILRLFTNNEILIDIAARYSRIMAFSMIPNSLVIVYIGARRSCGAPKFGTAVVSVSACTNVFLNYVLIFGNFGAPALGVEGAAIGTMITRTLELVITIVFIMLADRKKNTMAIYIKYILIPGRAIIKDFFKYSAPVMLNETLWSVGVSLYIVIYGHMAAASDIMAAHSLAGNVERILFLVVMSLAHASAVFIGKTIGSGKDAKEVYALGKTFMTLSITAGFITGLGIIAITFGIIEPLIFPFLDLTDAAMAICIFMLVLRGIYAPINAINTTCMVGVLRGGGAVKFILVADVIGIYLWAIPAAALCAFVFDLSIYVVYLIVLSENIIKMTLGIIRFKSKKWIRNVTRELDTDQD
jgi:Na+-driven multidrug efflux pump